jgi:hypothetical protein
MPAPLDKLSQQFRSAVLAGDHPGAERFALQYVEALREMWESLPEAERASSLVPRRLWNCWHGRGMWPSSSARLPTSNSRSWRKPAGINRPAGWNPGLARLKCESDSGNNSLVHIRPGASATFPNRCTTETTGLLAKKFVGSDSRLLQNRSECPFRNVPGVVRDGRVAVRRGVVPDLVTAGGLPIEGETQALSLRATSR